MIAYEDPRHRGNGPQYHTGKACLTPGCTRPAGTAWSRYWCFECNVERIKKIDSQLNGLIKKCGEPASDEEA